MRELEAATLNMKPNTLRGARQAGAAELGKAPPNLTMPPVSVSHTWPARRPALRGCATLPGG